MRYSGRSVFAGTPARRELGRGAAAVALAVAALGLPQAQAPASIQLDEVVVQGRDSEARVPPAFAGGQVAQGSRQRRMSGRAARSNVRNGDTPIPSCRATPHRSPLPQGERG